MRRAEVALNCRQKYSVFHEGAFLSVVKVDKVRSEHIQCQPTVVSLMARFAAL